MLSPRYNRCDYCGRNPHKVAVRLLEGPAAGTVRGYCPTCWRELQDRPHRAWKVIYDRRKRGR